MSKKAYILNHSHLADAIAMHNLLSMFFDCKIVHNGAPIEPAGKVGALSNVIECQSGYSYAIDTANADFLSSDATHALYICSDVILYEQHKVEQLFYAMPLFDGPFNLNIGMVSPSIIGRCWEHMKPQTAQTNTRQVPFCEGIVFMADRSIIEACGRFAPENIYGWGVDIWLGYLTNKLGMVSVVRDDITVIHPYGTAYDTTEARAEMIRWIHTKEQGFIDFCKSICLI